MAPEIGTVTAPLPLSTAVKQEGWPLRAFQGLFEHAGYADTLVPPMFSDAGYAYPVPGMV